MAQITKYVVRDNHDMPFFVFDTKSEKTAVVYKTKLVEETGYQRAAKILTTKYERIFAGDNLMKDPDYENIGRFRGNSILLKISDTSYVYVGDCVFSFEPVDEDTIMKYYSPVGNNDVPYPYAVGKKYVYFMWDKSYYPVELFDLKTDATRQMIRYTATPAREKGNEYMEMRKEFAKHGKKLKLKMIKGRGKK